VKANKLLLLPIPVFIAFALGAAAVIWRKDPIDARDPSLGAIGDSNNAPAMGLLRMHPESGQHFTNERGKAIDLTGSRFP
jgi:hypothetical protein